MSTHDKTLSSVLRTTTRAISRHVAPVGLSLALAIEVPDLRPALQAAAASWHSAVMTQQTYTFPRAAAALLAILLAACSGDDSRITAAESEPYAGIGEGEVIRFGGTEPFWGGEIRGDTLRYSTPEDPDGQTIAVKRFAGMNGLGFSGTLDGAAFDMTVTPGACSDGMSDRTYPFTVTLRLGDDLRTGCAHTDAQPFTGPENP